MHALIIHPFKPQADFLKKGLKDNNIYCDISLTLESAEQQILKQKYDLLVIKHLPQYFNAFIIAKEIYSIAQKKIQTVLLFDKKNKSIEKEASTKGFKYFIYPPFNSLFNHKIIKKIRLKHKIIPKIPLIKIRDIIVNTETRKVIKKGKIIPLCNKEFSLLEFLLLNKGKIINRPTILEHVWDRNINIFTNTIDVHVRHLRQKIDNGIKNKLIKTIPCAGYIIE